MSTSGTFELDGVSELVLINPRESVTYTLDTEAFSGVIYLEEVRTDGSGVVVLSQFVEAGMDEATGTYENVSDKAMVVRFRSEGLDDGESETVIYSITEVTGEVAEIVLQEKSGKRLMYINDQGRLVFDREFAASGEGAVNGTTVSVSENIGSVIKQSVITLASTPVTVANTEGASFGGAKIYDLPAGRILVLGCTADLSFDWSASGIVAAGSGDFSLGTTITEDATLDGTDVDLLPSTGLTDPFVSGVGAGVGALAVSAQFDGTTEAVDVNLNIIIDDADVEDLDEDIVLVSGTVTLTWINLGDY